MTWVNYIGQFAMLGLVVWIIVDKLRSTLEARKLRLQQMHQQQVTRPDAGRATARRLTPPPSPIDRMAFLQARIAYLAHMRDEVIEIDVKDETTKEVVQRSRKLTKKEMIEAVNLQNEDHVDALFETWDAAQKRQREP